jgi:hypothetical protein
MQAGSFHSGKRIENTRQIARDPLIFALPGPSTWGCRKRGPEFSGIGAELPNRDVRASVVIRDKADRETNAQQTRL